MSRQRKIVVVEDAPFLPDQRDQLMQFRDLLRSYLQVHVRVCTRASRLCAERSSHKACCQHGVFPLVFILADAAEGTSSLDYLLGDVRHSPFLSVVAFNPVNDTLLTKACRLVDFTCAGGFV